ncbi:hypothetical protein ACHAPT_010943 [Fusarium lateritium]
MAPGPPDRIVHDYFGMEQDKRRPLLLDTVMGHQPRASRSRLLQMPSEILVNIVELLSDSKLALANLALVNSDCQHLARTSQFAELKFDYGDRARQLFTQPAFQSVAQAQATSQASKPTIAACVRRVTFAPHPARVRALHSGLYHSIWNAEADLWSDEELENLRKEGTETYMGFQHMSIYTMAAMPNLEALIWTDPYPLDEYFFRLLTSS